MSRWSNLPRPGRNDRTYALLIAIGLWSIAAHAQDPIKAFPKNYSLVLDNSAVAVIRAHYGPREKIGVHDHSKFPTVYVYLSDSGPVRMEHFEEKSFVLTRPPTVKGSFRVSPGRPERHSVENMGDTSSDFLRVELKQVSLGLLEPFRGKAPPSPLQSQNSVEFTDHSLKIQRIICVGASTCPVKPSQVPSLIIAFTPLYVTTGASEKKEKLDAGAVRWLPSSQTATITPDAGSPAHILRILIPTARR
jgi:hypothetical protein